MKVLFPQSHNNCLVGDLDYGNAFFWEKDLFMKINPSAMRVDERDDLFYCVKINDGLVYTFGNIEVQFEPNVVISLLEKE